MTMEANVLIHWKGLRNDEDVQTHLSDRCREIAAEFPETQRYELSIEFSHRKIQCHGHVNGKQDPKSQPTPKTSPLRASGRRFGPR